MGRFTKRAIAGLTAALVVAGGAQAQFLLDDLEHGSNQNRVGQYWYFFLGDEYNYLEGKVKANPQAVITNAGPGDEFGDMSFKASPRALAGGSAATNGTYVAAMQYANWFDLLAAADLDVDNSTPTSAYPVVGMGTLLTGNDDTPYGSKFANVTSISFDMIAPAGVTVIFKVETIENSPTGPYGPGPDATNPTSNCVASADEGKKPLKKGCNPANAYAVDVKGTGAWANHKVSISPVTAPTEIGKAAGTQGTMYGGKAGDLAQKLWWGRSFTFNPANATKLAWQINGDANPTSTDGILAVDNIQLHGTGVDQDWFVPKNECRFGCLGSTLPEPNEKIGDFEGAEDVDGNFGNRVNAFGYYWYHYDDGEAGGSAMIGGLTMQDYAAMDDEGKYTQRGLAMDVENNGNGSNGAFIEFEIANPTFTHNVTGMDISSFVGIGTNLYDVNAATPAYFNASAHKGIYFEFKATGAVDFLTVEISDDKDVAQSLRPEGDDGQVFHMMIPVNGTEWKRVAVNLDSLSLPLWIKQGDRRYGQTLDKTKLAKVQFKYAGSGDGTIHIDNVYFYGGTPGSVKMVSNSKAKTSGIRASYNRGSVNVNWNAAQQISSGKIQLINTKGRVVSSAPISAVAGNRVTATLGGKSALPSGMYFVRIDARDVNGKRVVQQTPVSIVR